jgi:N-carbamoyl-L-amino-acid hydrolase
MNRRDFLQALAASVPGAAMAGSPLRARQPARPRIDALRLRQQLEALSVFGRPAGGSFGDGVSRTAYSEADVAGRTYVMGVMREAGLTPRIDPAGNIFAQRRGQDASLRPILFGSHIDSVPQGGNFDGDLGSLAAIETIRALNAAGLVTRHPLEVVVWAHEEGGTFPNGLNGSRAVAGQLLAGEMDQSYRGLRKADGIRRIGGDPDRIAEARRQPGSIHCYLELHIEQGGTLDRERINIGVVEGIVSISRFRAIVTGFANHAGTTTMSDRQDALFAASQLVLAVREEVTRVEGRQVGTVGRLEVTPNAANVIPGKVELTIELRDLSEAKLTSIANAIQSRARTIAASTKTTIEIAPTGHYGPALATPSVQAAIERAATSLGFTHMRLPSGAGHDAQMAATLGPMGMIFVPSIGGVSHSPKENTSWDDCARGGDILLAAVMEVDRLALS